MVEKFNNSLGIQTDNVVKPVAPFSGGPSFDTGVSGLDGLVKVLDNFVTAQSGILDKQTVSRAKKAGALAGLNANFAPAEGESLAAEAFNSAAFETFVNKTITDVSTTVNKIANRPDMRSNPQGLSEALVEIGQGMSADMPPEVVPQFELAYNRQVQSAVQNAQNNLYEVTLAESRASFMEMEKNLMINITNAARDGNEEALGEYMALYSQRLNNNAPIDSGGNGILQPGEFASRASGLALTVEKETIIGEMMRTPDSQKPAFVEGLLNGTRLDDIMTPLQQEEFARDMVRTYEAQSIMKDKIDSATGAAEVAEAKELEKLFVLEPSEDNFIQLMQHPKANNPFQYMQYLENRQVQSDPIALNELQEKADRGELTFQDLSFTDGDGEPNPGLSKISPKDRQELVKSIAETEAGGGFETLQIYREAMKRVDEDYGKEGLFGLLVSEEGKIVRRQVYDYMRTEYPKYLRGEIEFPDPIRKYNLVKQNYQSSKPKDDGIHQTTNADGDLVVIPTKYMDNPKLYKQDQDNGLLRPDLDDPIIEDAIIDLIIERESANGN